MKKLETIKLEETQAGGCGGSAGSAMGATIAAGFGIALGTVTLGAGLVLAAGVATAWAWADCYSSGWN
jgi:hypothetical protein